MFPRKFFRINYVTRATVTMPDGFFEGMTDNISAGGLFLRTDNFLQVGMTATISFNIPSASHPNISVNGEVVRNCPQGLAFIFKSIDYHTFTNLKAFIKHKPLPYW